MTATTTSPGTRAAPAGNRAPGSPSRYRSDAIDLAAHPAVVATARLRTRLALRAWQLDELNEDASQVVSELVTNSIEAHRREHLDAPVRLTLVAGLRTLLIIVRDASTDEPDACSPGADAEAGRGLLIVNALSARWDTKPVPGGGKVIRALIRAHPVTPARKPESAKEHPMPAPIHDELAENDRIYLEKLRLATNVLLQVGEDQGVLNDVIQTELFIFRDRIERALLLPAAAADVLPWHSESQPGAAQSRLAFPSQEPEL